MYGNTPLHRAVAQGDAECCRALLEGGADPLAHSRSMRATPLHVAVSPQLWLRRW